MFGFVSLVGFVLWLISFPMAGFLLKDLDLLPYFLTGHMVGFGLIYYYNYVFYRLAFPFVGVSSLLTFFFYFFPFKGLLMFLLGFFSSFLAVLVGYILSENVRVWSLLGLALGNVGVLLLMLSPFQDMYKMFLISLLPLVSLYKPINLFMSDVDKQGVSLQFLVGIFLLYITGGLMYRGIMSYYSEKAYFLGIEVVFYAIAVAIAYFVISKGLKEDYLLHIAVLCFAFSFSLMHIQMAVSLNLVMFLMQMAFGFTDTYLLYSLMKIRNPLKAFPVGFGTVCLAILSGYLLAKLSLHISFLLMVGNLALIAYVLYKLYAVKPAQEERVEQEVQNELQEEPINQEEKHSSPELEFLQEMLHCMDADRKRLSTKELEVLTHILKGKSYKEIAEEMFISVSSVRQHCRRAMEKLNMAREGLEESYKKWQEEHSKEQAT